MRVTDAIRLCRRGDYEELPRWRALDELDRLRQQDLESVRNFVSWARLTGFPLSSAEDGAVLAMLRGAIKNRDLVLLRKNADGANVPVSATAEQRQLIAKIEARTHARLNYLGRHYKLVADVDLNKTPQRNSYEVVHREDAVQVLDGLAKQTAGSPDLPPLLAKAREKLAADWRPPFFPDGLVLLRRISSPVSAVSSPEMPITPSQMKALVRAEQNVAFEVVVLGMDDKPAEGVLFTIEAPDNEEYDGSFSASGKFDIESGKTGPARVTLAFQHA